MGSSYSENQLMHIFLDKFHLGGKYTAQIASHQAELRREKKFTDQKNLYQLHLYTLIIKNLTAVQVQVKIMREKILFTQNALFVKV